MVQEAGPTTTPTTSELPPWMIPAIAVGAFIGCAAIVGVGAYMLLRRQRKTV